MKILCPKCHQTVIFQIEFDSLSRTYDAVCSNCSYRSDGVERPTQLPNKAGHGYRRKDGVEA